MSGRFLQDVGAHDIETVVARDVIERAKLERVSRSYDIRNV